MTELSNQCAPQASGPGSRRGKRTRNKSHCLIPSSGNKSCKWTFSEERYFFEHLRVAFNRSSDECAKDIASVLRTKSEEEVRKYYSMIVRRIMKYAAPDANLEQYATANIHRSMIFYWDTVLLPCRENRKKQLLDKEDIGTTTIVNIDASLNKTAIQDIIRNYPSQLEGGQLENSKNLEVDGLQNNCGIPDKGLVTPSNICLLESTFINSQKNMIHKKGKIRKSKRSFDVTGEQGIGQANIKKAAQPISGAAKCLDPHQGTATTELLSTFVKRDESCQRKLGVEEVQKVEISLDGSAVQLKEASLARDVQVQGPEETPLKQKSQEIEADPILRFQTESWACLSPPPNFELPPDFHKEASGVDVFNTYSFGGCSILLPSNSLLEAGDKMNKPVGNAANVMRKGIEALFMQIKDDKANPSINEFQPTKSHAEHESFTQGLLKEGMTNSSWLIEFERNQNEKQEKRKIDGRPFAVLFGNEG